MDLIVTWLKFDPWHHMVLKAPGPSPGGGKSRIAPLLQVPKLKQLGCEKCWECPLVPCIPLGSAFLPATPKVSEVRRVEKE